MKQIQGVLKKIAATLRTKLGTTDASANEFKGVIGSLEEIAAAISGTGAYSEGGTALGALEKINAAIENSEAIGAGGSNEIPAELIDGTITDIVIPDGVESVRLYGMYALNHVKSVTLPDSLKTIGSNAFYGLGNANGGVKFDLIANGVTEIDGFSNASNIKKIVLPSVTKIKASCFNGCTSVGYVYIGPNCTNIGSAAFGGVPITCKVECGFAEGAVSGFPDSAGWAGDPASLDITYNVASPTE